jgi:hypothetical protein
MDMVLHFDGSDDTSATVRGILTTNSSCKTATGVGIGTDKITVINSYPENKKYAVPEYEEYPVRSKTKFVVVVMDTAYSRAMQFHLIDKKVISMEVNSYFEMY